VRRRKKNKMHECLELEMNVSKHAMPCTSRNEYQKPPSHLLKTNRTGQNHKPKRIDMKDENQQVHETKNSSDKD